MNLLLSGGWSKEVSFSFRVRVSPAILESMALAAVEAYCFARKGKTPSKGPIKRMHTHEETLGYLWGFKKFDESNQVVIFSVERFSVSISSTRAPDSVVPNDDAVGLLDGVVQHISPQLSFLGDFHSHPYNSLAEVKKHSGFDFSDQDFESFEEDDTLWAQAGNWPIMLVMTVCRLGKVKGSTLDYRRNNIASFAAGQFQFWLNASVGRIIDNKRVTTRNKKSSVDLDVDNYLYNEPGKRLRERHQ